MSVIRMREAHPVERQFGMELYSTDFDGVGGRLKRYPTDFIVEEITPEGRILTVELGDSTDDISHPIAEIAGERSRYVTFTVQKINLSTLDVATILAAELRLPRQFVSYAGLKDRRAVTAQAMSVPARVTEALASLRLSRITIRDLHFTERPVQTGDLWGNRFTIRLREAQSTCNDALPLIQEIGSRTLLNYFGVQRFGVTRPYTHLVGKAVLKGDFESAIRLMLTTVSDFEPPKLTEARLRLSDDLHPDDSIISQFPDDLRYEKTVLRELLKHPGEYERAFLKIPPRVQTLFIHAYQSYLFNRLISHRARSGLSLDRPVPGDFLVRLDTTHAGRDSWVYVTERNLDERTEAVARGEYGVAAPVPGYATKCPSSPQTDTLVQLLRDEGITLKMFRRPGRAALDSPGGLHLIGLHPLDLEAWCEQDDIVTRFRLRKGSYATVVMRELMKNHPLFRV